MVACFDRLSMTIRILARVWDDLDVAKLSVQHDQIFLVEAKFMVFKFNFCFSFYFCPLTFAPCPYCRVIWKYVKLQLTTKTAGTTSSPPTLAALLCRAGSGLTFTPRKRIRFGG